MSVSPTLDTGRMLTGSGCRIQGEGEEHAGFKQCRCDFDQVGCGQGEAVDVFVEPLEDSLGTRKMHCFWS